MKKNSILVAFSLLTLSMSAQESTSAFNFLKLPTSSHVTALGGQNISAVNDDAGMGQTNPALLANVSDRTLSLNFMTYVADSKWMGGQFVKAFGERHTGSISVNCLSYGKQDETDANGTVTGSFTPIDLSFNLGYSYLLSDRWSGGAALKYIYSSYAGYSAMAMAVDAGINYYNDESDFSASAVVKTVGVQLKKFDDRRERLPYDVQLGITKGFDHAPIRLSLTMVDLTRWKSSDYYHPDDETLKVSTKILNHFVVGVDIIPSKNFYLSAGYNFRRAYELKAGGKAHGAGWTAGGGFEVKRFKAGISYARYHVSASSLMFNVAYAL